MKYKKAASQGAYIDRLRTTYPFKICRSAEPQYPGVLCGVRDLGNGQYFPVYRFPEYVLCVTVYGPGITILEW